MDGKGRREHIITLLKTSKEPLSGTQLAVNFSVSRQVIVQDIALLRTAGHNIIATNKGYQVVSQSIPFQRVFKVYHTDEQMEDELCSIVDLGGTLLDVFVSHKAYGLIKAPLNIRSRHDIATFLTNIETGQSMPLKNITSNYHYHTVTAPSNTILDLIYDTLSEKGYLVSIDDWDWQKYIKQ